MNYIFIFHSENSMLYILNGWLAGFFWRVKMDFSLQQPSSALSARARVCVRFHLLSRVYRPENITGMDWTGMIESSARRVCLLV